MGVVWVHWLMARGQILKESLVPLATPYRRTRGGSSAHERANDCPRAVQP